MPIKADSLLTLESDMSRNSTILNINNSTISLSKEGKKHQNSHKTTGKSSTKLVANIEGGEQLISVACRIRPLTEEEILEGSTLIGHKVADDNMIVLMDPLEDSADILRANRSREKQFVFDMVLDARSTQQDVYEGTTKGLLGGVLDGYNATVFAYGATGAGKTYTMLGTEEEPGVMFRTLHDLFIEISKKSDDLMYQVSLSYLEIYNELIRDLLSPSNGFLELREDAKGGVQVAGISELIADTPEEVMYMLHKGNKERTQEPTKANKTSSRSHAVLQVNIKQRNKARKHQQEIRLGKLYMIDLAGSERAAQTQNTGKRMVEGAHINRSLLALGNCINALSEKGSTKYVNYRDSKLTRILKDSLGGNSKTVMIAHVSPASIHFEESRNTLVYADRAKYIRTKLRRNVIDVSYHISQYQQIIQELAHEISTLKDQRHELESRISHLDPRMGLINNEDKLKLEEALKLRESLLQAFKMQISLRKKVLELDNAIMDLNIEVDRHNKIIDNSDSTRREENGDSVLNSKEELKVVEQDKDELEVKRTDAMRELDQCKAKTRKLRDIASKKLTNQEQKEILSLLLKNFEFEIKNIEMQANIFKRDFKLREQDMVILRLEQHRSLCDTLIFQQRRLIIDNNLQIPHDLDELYFLYSRDINDGQLMKDVTGIGSSGRSSGSLMSAATSPKPSGNTFLTQIQEESSVTPSMFDDDFNYLSKIQPKKGENPWSKKTTNKQHDQEKIFQMSNKVPHKVNKSGNSNNKQQIMNAGNFISGNGRGGFDVTNAGPQTTYVTNKDNKNNISMLSASTNDSNANNNIEVIIEKANNQTNNKQLTAKTYNTRNDGGFNPKATVAPGQVLNINTNQRNQPESKKLTQGIAAIAAQRKANQHHKELMQEMQQTNEGLTVSSLAKHDQLSIMFPQNNNNVGMSEYLFEKKNSVLTDGSVKAKKQVKIKDIVQYKLPSDNTYLSDDVALNISKKNGTQGIRKTSLDSPIGLSKMDESANKKAAPSVFSSNANNNKKNKNRSKSNNYAQITNQGFNMNANKTNANNFSINNLTTINTGSSNEKSNINNKTTPKESKIPPSIPNYSKGINISISGTSVLNK